MWIAVGVVLLIIAVVVIVKRKRRDGPGVVTNVQVRVSDD